MPRDQVAKLLRDNPDLTPAEAHAAVYGVRQGHIELKPEPAAHKRTEAAETRRRLKDVLTGRYLEHWKAR